MRKLTSLGAKLFLLLYCTNLFMLSHASTDPEPISSTESELDSDYHDDYVLDDIETSSPNDKGCEEGMFQCADK
jgi:hypothetical protein